MKYIIIETGTWWLCETFDQNSKIIDKGICYLLDNDKILYAKGFNNDFFRKATEDEYKSFYHKKGFIFKGDKVVITKGRKLPIGKEYVVKDFYRFVAYNTYGHRYTDYVIFTTGEKTALKNVRIPGFEDLNNVYKFVNGFNISGPIYSLD